MLTRIVVAQLLACTILVATGAEAGKDTNTMKFTSSYELRSLLPIWEGKPIENMEKAIGCEASGFLDLCKNTITIVPEEKFQICNYSVENINKNNDAYHTITDVKPTGISIYFYARGSDNPLDRWGSHIKVDVKYSVVPSSLTTVDLRSMGCNTELSKTNECRCLRPNDEVIASPKVCSEFECSAECKRYGGAWRYGGKDGC